ncbi:hypothetical protein HRD57_10495 [Tetragenococcus halophilus]|nr:hypothetical protein [Tetragenococcus halophilus]
MKKTIKWSCCLLTLLQFSTGTTRVMADSMKETSVEKMSQPATKNQKEKGDQTTWQLITSLGEEYQRNCARRRFIRFSYASSSHSRIK